MEPIKSLCHHPRIQYGRVTLLNESPIDRDEIAKKHKIKAMQAILSLNLATDEKSATALVMTGRVLLENGQIVKSAAQLLKYSDAMKLRLKSSKTASEPFVSRAGRKLDHAMKTYPALQRMVAGGRVLKTRQKSPICLYICLRY